MKTSQLVTFCLLIFSPALWAQESPNLNQKYAADSLVSWTDDLMLAMSASHPGFYRYTTPARFQHLIDSTQQTITDSLTTLEYYRKLKPLFAQIGCVHTSINLVLPLEETLDQQANLLPLGVFIESDGRCYITKNYQTEVPVPLGSELLAIDGEPIQKIIPKLLAGIPTDGYNQTGKLLLLKHRFAFWYRTMIKRGSAFELEIQTGGKIATYKVPAATAAPFPSYQSIASREKEQLAFEVLNDSVAVLTVRNFSKSAIREGGQKFKPFIKSTFKTLNEKQIQHLIVDVRNNTGGTDGNAVFLTRHFFDTSFRYWDKLEVTEAVAVQIKGIQKLFFRAPVKRDTTYQWRKARLTNEFDYYQEQKPAKRTFQGKTYLLSNGLCLSSCSDFIAILASNQKAIVIGEESGGGFQGNTSGMIITTPIFANLEITIPLQKYTNAVPESQFFGRGTIPSHHVAADLEAWMANQDVVLAYALKLVGIDQ